MELTSENVYTIFADCLFRKGEDTTGFVKSEGIVQSFGFHPGRLESHRQDIVSLLAKLPREFRPKEGGGYSFLNSVLDADQRQWGDQSNAEQLVVLAIASNLASYQAPRNMWDIFPGGVPYIVLSDSVQWEAVSIIDQQGGGDDSGVGI